MKQCLNIAASYAKFGYTDLNNKFYRRIRLGFETELIRSSSAAVTKTTGFIPNVPIDFVSLISWVCLVRMTVQSHLNNPQVIDKRRANEGGYRTYGCTNSYLPLYGKVCVNRMLYPPSHITSIMIERKPYIWISPPVRVRPGPQDRCEARSSLNIAASYAKFGDTDNLNNKFYWRIRLAFQIELIRSSAAVARNQQDSFPTFHWFLSLISWVCLVRMTVQSHLNNPHPWNVWVYPQLCTFICGKVCVDRMFYRPTHTASILISRKPYIWHQKKGQFGG